MAEPIPQWRLLDAAMQHLDGGLLRVFYALTAFRQAGHAETWPSIANVAERANVSRRQVSRCLRRLEVLGWVSRQHDPHTQATPRYLLSIGEGMTSRCHGGMTSTCHAGGDDIQVSWGHDIGDGMGGMTSRCHPDDQRNTPEEDQNTPTHTRTPAQALTASPDAVGRAGVYEAGPVPEQVPERRPLPIQPVPRLPIAPPPAPPSAEAPHPMLVKRPGALGVHPEQREASLAAVHEAPVSRGTRNLTLVDGPPKRPPVYRVGGKELPGALSELLPPALSRLLAPHFRGDDFRSGTQKLFEATDLRFLPGASSEGVRVDLALHFDRVWGIRPKALATVEVPYVAYGVNAREDLERLWTHRKGVCPDKDALIQLVPDDDRRKAMIAELRALGGAQVDGPGWRALSAAMQARQAAK